MAFVFKEERKFINDTIKSKELPGPGEYLPQTDVRFLKVSQAPFSTQEEKLKLSLNPNPGPGTYYQDTIDKKLQQIIAKSEIVSSIQADNVEQDNSLPFEITQGKKYQIRPTIEKLGFDIKAKRFVEKEDDNPGPANYFKQQKRITSARPNSSKPPTIKTRLKSAKGQSIPSIPYKDNIGFEIGPNQQLIKNINHEKYKFFRGEKGDSVGPGNYDIDNPNIWRRTGCQWSKMKEIRGTSASSVKTRPQTANENKQSMSNFHLSTRKKMQPSNTASVLSANRLKRKNNFTQKLFEENKHTEYDLYYDVFKKYTSDQIPGPGYYIDMTKQSSFQTIPYAESRQFFGSNEQRFGANKGNSDLGPTTYFQTVNNIWTVKNTITKYKGMKQNSTPFSTNAKRFDSNYLDNEKNNEPGPGAYNPKIITMIEHNNYNNDGVIFNGREKRFDEKHSQLKWQIDTPGPGAYIDPYSATGTSNTVKWQGLYLDLRKGNKLKRPQSSTLTKIIKKHEEVRPEIGTYNPDKTFSIAYNVKKKASKKHSDEIAFSSSKSKQKEVIKSNVGPGFYHRDSEFMPMQIYPPFHQSDHKLKSLNGLVIGPGQYDSTSFFDWNKKTYNASFL